MEIAGKVLAGLMLLASLGLIIFSFYSWYALADVSILTSCNGIIGISMPIVEIGLFIAGVIYFFKHKYIYPVLFSSLIYFYPYITYIMYPLCV